MTGNSTREELKKDFTEINKESTERRLIEEELYTVRAALNSAVNGVIITDKRGRIKYANPAFLKMFEYESPKEVMGKYAAEMFTAQEGRRFIDLGIIIDKSKGETEEFQGIREDGNIFNVEVSTSSITGNLGHDVGGSLFEIFPLRTTYEIKPNSLIAFEFIVFTPAEEWGGNKVPVCVEENALITERGIEWVHPPQERVLVIR